MIKETKISVIIIAKNEQEKIVDAIDSVLWTSEVIVVDTGSSDLTCEMAKRMGARVVSETKGSYNTWRNRGLKEAKGEWILYLDADERVTPKLRNEILELISDFQISNTNAAYAIPRKNIVLGKELKHGGFGKYDFVKRLFLKDKLIRWIGKIHEEPEFDGGLGYLKNKLVHLKAQKISEMIEKTNKWSGIEAKLMREASHPPMNIARFMSAMFREFWFRFIKRRAFLDGSIGVIHGWYQVFSRFVSYAKLWEMQEKKSR